MIKFKDDTKIGRVENNAALRVITEYNLDHLVNPCYSNRMCFNNLTAKLYRIGAVS